MKEIISVRSNAFYKQEEDKEKFELQPCLELVIIHSDGKSYKVKGKDLVSETNYVEIRLIASPEVLTYLITELQLHQTKMNGIKNNADQLNALVKHITEDKQ